MSPLIVLGSLAIGIAYLLAVVSMCIHKNDEEG